MYSKITWAGAFALTGFFVALVIPSALSAITLQRTLQLGATGEDVRALQQFLAQDPGVYPERLVTGYFGPLTQQAVQRWQAQYGVVSGGGPGSTGWGVVGPRTREALAASARGSVAGQPGSAFSRPSQQQADSIAALQAEAERLQNLLRNLTPGALPAAQASCVLDDVIVPHGVVHTFYSAGSAPSGQSCLAQERTCLNGVLSGNTSYRNASCAIQEILLPGTVAPDKPITSQPGPNEQCNSQYDAAVKAIPANQNCTAQYADMACGLQNSFVKAAPNGCLISELEKRGWKQVAQASTCQAQYDAAVKAIPANQNCTAQYADMACGTQSSFVRAASNGCLISELEKRGWKQAAQTTLKSCTFGGKTVAHGKSVSGYQASSVAFGQTCRSQTRTCSDGKLSGTYQYAACKVGNPKSCTFNGKTVAHGASVTAYQHQSYQSLGVQPGAVAYCPSQTRTCNNGTLSGSYQYASCVMGL